jgi:hypothetical protein
MEHGRLLALMDALETRLKTIPGLRASAHEADSISPPWAMVGLPEIDDYRLTMRRGFLGLQFRVIVLVSAAVDRTGQRALAEYASTTGEKSIPRVLEEDQNLGGVAQTCVVNSFRPLGADEVGAIGYYGGEFAVTVVVKGQGAR